MNLRSYKLRFLLAFVIILFVSSSLVAFLCLKHSGDIITLFGEEAFGKIFSQLEKANIRPSYLISFVLSAALGFVAVLILKIKNSFIRIIIFALFAVVSLLTVTSLTILFANVNGIRVQSVLTSLIKALNNGLSNELRVIVL